MSVGFTRRYGDWVVRNAGGINPALWVVVSDLDSKKVYFGVCHEQCCEYYATMVSAFMTISVSLYRTHKNIIVQHHTSGNNHMCCGISWPSLGHSYAEFMFLLWVIKYYNKTCANSSINPIVVRGGIKWLPNQQ